MKVARLRQLAQACRHHEFTWRYTFNLSATLAFKISRRQLSEPARRALADLNFNGIAITTVDELLTADSSYNELKEAIGKLEAEQDVLLAAARAAANDEQSIGRKSFNLELLGENPVLDPGNIYSRFALQKPILQIANSYFGMLTRLRYYNAWRTFASQGRARESQLWHCDREDLKILKVFVYLSDVDEGAGPLTYAAGSHLKGKARPLPEYFIEGGVKRSYDSQMAKVVPPEKWVKAVGPKGTIVFADTSGYHKGGLARERDRLMYLCMFTSQSSQSKELFKRCGEIVVPQDKELAFALKAARAKSSGS